MAYNPANKKLSVLTLSALLVCASFSIATDTCAQDFSVAETGGKMRFNIPSTFLKMPKSMVEKQRRADELQTKTYDELQFESGRNAMYSARSAEQNRQLQQKIDAEFSEITTRNAQPGGKKIYRFDVDETQTKTTTIYKDEVVVLKAPVRRAVAPSTVGMQQGYYSPQKHGTYMMPSVRSPGGRVTTTPGAKTTVSTEITETEYVRHPSNAHLRNVQQKPVFKMEKFEAFGPVALRKNTANESWNLQASPPKGGNIAYVKSDKIYVVPTAQKGSQKSSAEEKNTYPIKGLSENNLPRENVPAAVLPTEKPFVIKEQKDVLKKNDNAKSKPENDVKTEKKTNAVASEKSPDEAKSVQEKSVADSPKKINRNEVFKSFVYAPNRKVAADEYQSTTSTGTAELGLDTVRIKAEETKSETEKILMKVDKELSASPTEVAQ